MAKETKSFSLQERNAEWVSSKDNASAWLDRVIENARKTGDTQGAVINVQIQQKKREKENAKNKVENLESDIQELKQLKRSMDDHEEQSIKEAAEKLPSGNLEPTNPGVENWARKLEIKPVELVERVAEYREDNIQ